MTEIIETDLSQASCFSKWLYKQGLIMNNYMSWESKKVTVGHTINGFF